MGNRLMHYQAKPIIFDSSRRYEQAEKRATYTKPKGFWVSVDGEYGWPEWCRAEEYGTDSLVVAHEVRLTGSANVRRVTSVQEIDQFHNEFAAPTASDIKSGCEVWLWGIEWPRVARLYDGIIITPYLWERRYAGDTSWYYGWDCASGCIWNLTAIESVTVLSEVAQ